MITDTDLVSASNMPLDRARIWTDPLNAAMHEFEINTLAREAAFLAQIMHESGCLKYVREIWGPTFLQTKYERNFAAAWPPSELHPENHIAYKLGNDLLGDGKKYMGRGPIQNTGKKNYALLSNALGIDLVAHPELLEHPETGSRAAGWFWTKGAGMNLSAKAVAHGVEPGCNLNDLADAGDFYEITLAVNGGDLGFGARSAYWAAFKKVLGVA